MRFVIVTGMSGGGKSTAIHMLEDAGYYCVDNLPFSLIEKFVELILLPDSGKNKVVLGLDVRGGEELRGMPEVVDMLRQKGVPVEVLFMETDDSVLVKRYKESRRLHPLAQGERIEEGIKREREILAGIRAKADYVIDTSRLLTRELRIELNKIFVENASYNNLIVTILSFGFKYGIPQDADLVFDVRFLPNPFYVEKLRPQTGNDKDVQDYVKSFPECGEFVDKLEDMLKFLIPGYIKEGKYQLVVAIGCTGGQHRSVTIANELFARMYGKGNYGLKIAHRDVDKAAGANKK
ncbi:RNase adapter RapZ [Butyrivibrio sp. NC3005]|uniref:RNase adapter RapZ n=1 Tax=Butyrivibrio sp. NC3005 TaxID=1280685 RepID=UPI000426F075|nr:RNase adapter RapZ [Butyrivibrio sp. NC3005]